MRTVRRIAIAAIALVVLAGAVAWLLLRPPQPRRVERRNLALHDVTVVEPGRDRRPGLTLEIRDGRIAAISASASPAPSDAPFAGRFVLPGLIDLHVHHPIGRLEADVRYFGLLYLSHGVTTVRDCGSVDGSILGIRARAAAAEFPAPRIFACGPILDGDPPLWPGAAVVRSAAEAERIVDELAAQHVDCIKVYSNLPADALPGVRAAAARHGLPVIGHVPHVAFDAPHVDEAQHLTGIAGAGAGGDPSALAAVLSGWDSVSGARIERAVRISVERGIAHTPTLGVIDRVLELGDASALARDPAVLRLPRYYRDLIWKPGAMGGWALPPLGAGAAERIRANFCNAVRSLREAGVAVHVGSDAMNPFVVPGVSLHQELVRFTECGFSAEEAWRAATRGNAQALRAAQLGRLEAGAPADLLVFAEDPTRELAALATLEAVVAGGRLYTREFLAEERARYEAYFASWLYDRAMPLAFRLFAGRQRDDRPPR